MPTAQRVRRSETEWRQILQAFADSGLSAKTFCEHNHIAYGTFVRWRSKLSGQREAPTPDPSPSDWLPIHLTDASPARERAWEIELELPGGVQLRMRAA